MVRRVPGVAPPLLDKGLGETPGPLDG
jgi:hypothetical protein